MTEEILVADIGGTHARFAIASIDAESITLSEPAKLATADFDGLPSAIRAFAEQIGRALPKRAAIAIAGPVRGVGVQMTNSPWRVDFAAVEADLRFDACLWLNDFEAVAHAVGAVPESNLRIVCGPGEALPRDRPCTVVGPGTGLGVAILLPDNGRVIATEGGHVDFAPLDEFEEALRAKLRAKHGRVSVERVVSGSALRAIVETLAEADGVPTPQADDRTLWTRALATEDALASTALDRFCRSLGSVSGDLALAHGPGSVVIAGGLGLRLADKLPQSGFRDRFVAKGRYRQLMESLPVKAITHPEPGLLGAASAFAKEHVS